MNQHTLIDFDTYVYEYFIKWFDVIYPKQNTLIEKIIIISFHLIHIVIILFNIVGAFLPPKYLIIYVIFSLILVSTWYIYGKCPILYSTYIKDKKNYDFVPIKNTTRCSILLFFFITSIIGIQYPDYSLFRLLKKIIKYIDDNYDN